mmetsp:Transcript_134320/g.287314  ORF Transcript_134320/g.287314 Transcript_134320/m.287314 type:complete len:83 (+) Transcript_134320:178-426(+)
MSTVATAAVLSCRQGVTGRGDCRGVPEAEPPAGAATDKEPPATTTVAALSLQGVSTLEATCGDATCEGLPRRPPVAGAGPGS